MCVNTNITASFSVMCYNCPWFVMSDFRTSYDMKKSKLQKTHIQAYGSSFTVSIEEYIAFDIMLSWAHGNHIKSLLMAFGLLTFAIFSHSLSNITNTKYWLTCTVTSREEKQVYQQYHLVFELSNVFSSQTYFSFPFSTIFTFFFLLPFFFFCFFNAWQLQSASYTSSCNNGWQGFSLPRYPDK